MCFVYLLNSTNFQYKMIYSLAMKRWKKYTNMIASNMLNMFKMVFGNWEAFYHL